MLGKRKLLRDLFIPKSSFQFFLDLFKEKFSFIEKIVLFLPKLAKPLHITPQISIIINVIIGLNKLRLTIFSFISDNLYEKFWFKCNGSR